MQTGGLGKNLAGEQFGGEGTETPGKSDMSLPTHGGETKGMKPMEGPNVDHKDGAEEKGFSLNSASYKGPDNWTPDNMGVRNPDDLSSTAHKVPHGK